MGKPLGKTIGTWENHWEHRKITGNILGKSMMTGGLVLLIQRVFFSASDVGIPELPEGVE